MADRFRDGIGMDTEQENAPSEFLMDGGRQGRQVGGIIMSTARDSGSTPTTTLRAGLVMGRITITDLWKEYDDGDSDGTNVARAILVKDVNLLNNAGTAVNSDGPLHQGGYYDEDYLYGLDDNGEADLRTFHSSFKKDLLP